MTEKNAMIKISAKETEITGKNAKPQIIPELCEYVVYCFSLSIIRVRMLAEVYYATIFYK